MNTPADARLRCLAYTLLITVTAGAVGGRIVGAARVYEPYLFRPAGAVEDPRLDWPTERPRPMPTFGSNDRSRWATIRALVEEGTYIIGHQDVDAANHTYTNHGIIADDGWQTVDKVRNPETHDFYSSKPPLLPTLLAGEYWLLKHVLGWSLLDETRWQVFWVVLFTVNWLPLVCYLFLLARLVERFGTTDWGRLYVMTAACFGTFVTTFMTTLNNHTLATCCAVFALYPVVRIWYGGERSAWLFLVAGFFAGFTACNELPAASFAAVLVVALLLKAPRQTLTLFVPAALVPVAAFFLANYAALDTWRPAYSEFGGPWYDYPGSNWTLDPTRPRLGIDYAGLKENKATYAFHLLLGHHGLFSLSPIFLLAVAGMIVGARHLWSEFRGSGEKVAQPAHTDPSLELGPQPGLSPIAVATLVLTLVLIGFYLIKTSNYGGVSRIARWLMWLTPLLLLTLLPVADWLAACRWGRGLGYVLLAISVFSANYPAWNPWRHPWIYNLMEARGWIQY